MCAGDDAAGLARKQRAAVAGAIEAAVKQRAAGAGAMAALQAHPQVEDVQEMSCRALTNVCCGTERRGAGAEAACCDCTRARGGDSGAAGAPRERSCPRARTGAARLVCLMHIEGL
uniref:Uncharacterized protein n=1 Tax=Emiliania huxleyi TaxID=2903 RepID=A0A7S3SSY1_EMIHU